MNNSNKKKQSVNDSSENSRVSDTVLDELFDSGSTRFTFFRCFAWVLNIHESLFLQDLLNHWRGPHTVKEEIDGQQYMLCTTEYLSQSLKWWTKDAQSRLLTVLKERGLIDVVRHGLPARRYIKINRQEVIRLLERGCENRDSDVPADGPDPDFDDNKLSRNLDNKSVNNLDTKRNNTSYCSNTNKKDSSRPASRERTTPSKTDELTGQPGLGETPKGDSAPRPKIKKTNIPIPPPDNSRFEFPEEENNDPPESPGKILADKFFEIVLKHGKIQNTSHYPNTAKKFDVWVRLFDGFLTNHDFDEVNDALTWYDRHIDKDGFCIHAITPQGFIDKYASLEAIMKIDRERISKKKKKEAGIKKKDEYMHGYAEKGLYLSPEERW